MFVVVDVLCFFLFSFTYPLRLSGTAFKIARDGSPFMTSALLDT